MSSLLAKLGFGAPSTEEISEILLADTPVLDGAELAIAYFSSRLGGDLHDFVRVSPTRFLFGMLDVAGKRQASAAVLDAVQASFRSSAEELFSATELNELDAMIELSRRLNLEIMRSAGGVRSCPAFTGCYNEELGTVCYVNAGHTPALVRDGDGIVELPATGLPLGLFSLAPTDACIVGLEPDASLVVVSRGVVEAESKGRELGLEGVKTAMQASPTAANAEDISRWILEHVQEFMHTVPKHNDVTALTLTRKGPSAIGPHIVPSVK
jgi:serine phosphatase RsbU (regulator of sigma subunit)